MSTTITSQEKEMFDYLNDLGKRGVTNMFGASPYLQREFGIERKLASDTLIKWMEMFNADGYDHLTISE